MRAAAAEALAAAIERAARLVEQLLALARSEPGAVAAASQRLDLGELVREAAADTVPLALRTARAVRRRASDRR